MYLFSDITDRLKKELNYKNDKQLYDLMGVGQGTFSNWKTRNTIPYEEIISLCEKQKFNLKYILTGQKEENFVNFKEENLKIINESDEKTQEKIYHLLKSQIC